MANVKIRELESGSISDNNDYFVVATNDGNTVKIPYSALATFLFGTSLVQGNNISIVDATQQDGIKRYSISATATTTVDVGTTTTGAAGTNASVTNSGTTSDAVFNFTIPRGADGANGANGADGASISVSISPITGGHTVTFHSTDPNVNDQTFNVMDGTEIIQTSSDDRLVTLTVAGWQGVSAPYTQSVTVSGMTSNIVPIIAPSYSDTVATGLEQQTEWSKITKAVSSTDTITFKCYEEKPTVELTAIVKVV